VKKRTPALKFVLIILIGIAISVSLATGATDSQPVVYHGNTKSHVFHAPDCRYYNCKICTTEFTSKEEAVAAGYTPCKACLPE
jgi:hypothetical protein